MGKKTGISKVLTAILFLLVASTAFANDPPSDLERLRTDPLLRKSGAIFLVDAIALTRYPETSARFEPAIDALDSGELSTARRELRELARLGVDSPQMDFYLGRLHHAQGHHLKALRRYNRAVERDPCRVQARINAIVILREMGRFELLVSAADELLLIDDNATCREINGGTVTAQILQASPLLDGYDLSDPSP